MLEASEQMIKKVESLSSTQILSVWDHTEKSIMSVNNVLIRDAVMAAVEKKYPLLYDNWMSNDYSKNPAGDKLSYWFKIFKII